MMGRSKQEFSSRELPVGARQQEGSLKYTPERPPEITVG